MDNHKTLAQQLRALADARRQEDEQALLAIRARATHNANEGKYQTTWPERVSTWLRNQLQVLGFEMKEDESTPEVTYIMW